MQICGQLIPVVIPPRPVIVPGAARIVTMTPGPVVFVIVMAMTWSDIHSTRSDLYAHVARRSGLRSARQTQEGNS
jgi:hypothetical protein